MVHSQTIQAKISSNFSFDKIRKNFLNSIWKTAEVPIITNKSRLITAYLYWVLLAKPFGWGCFVAATRFTKQKASETENVCKYYIFSLFSLFVFFFVIAQLNSQFWVKWRREKPKHKSTPEKNQTILRNHIQIYVIIKEIWMRDAHTSIRCAPAMHPCIAWKLYGSVKNAHGERVYHKWHWISTLTKTTIPTTHMSSEWRRGFECVCWQRIDSIRRNGTYCRRTMFILALAPPCDSILCIMICQRDLSLVTQLCCFLNFVKSDLKKCFLKCCPTNTNKQFTIGWINALVSSNKL